MLAPPSQSQTSGTLEELSVTVAGAAQGVRLLPVSREGFAAPAHRLAIVVSGTLTEINVPWLHFAA